MIADAPAIPDWPDEEVRPFLVAMRANPDDHTAALVFADWLQERNDPRGDMIRASCELDRRPRRDGPDWDDLVTRVQPWSICGPMLPAWIGEMAECSFWVDGLTRGLLSLHVNADCGWVEEGDYPHFFAAYRQGWVDRATFGGLPSQVFDQCPLVQSVLLGVDRLELYSATRYAGDDDLIGVADLPNLAELAVEEFRAFTDAGLAHLRNHPRLERVLLFGEFTSAGYAHLRTLPRLRPGGS